MSDAASSIPFVFVAIKPAGGRTVGVRYASDQSTLASALSKDHLLLLRSWRLPSWTGRSETLSLKDQMALNEQLAALVDRGVPLVEALEVAESVVSKQSQPIVHRLRDLVSAGDSFAEACQRTGAFDDVVITVYRAAEKSGQLGLSARRLAESSRRRLTLQGKAATMLVYPAVVLAIAVIVTTIVLMFVVPSIAETLRQMGGDLPWYTVIVMGAGEGLRENWLIAMTITGAALTLGIFMWRSVVASLFALLRKAPLVGDVLLIGETARFFAVMGAMTRTGVPLADALTVSTGVISHPKLRAQLEELGRGLVEGGVLKTLVEDMDALPLSTRKLLIAADRAGDMDDAFEALASDLAENVDTQTQRAMSLIEPLLIVALFLVVGSILMAVMFPLMTLGSRIQ